MALAMRNDKTLSELRKACKAIGVKVKKQTFSDGPFVSFSCADTGQVIHSTQVCLFDVKEKSAKLDEIKKEFHGMEIDGSYVYGLKP
jgi:hypothetical protein